MRVPKMAVWGVVTVAQLHSKVQKFSVSTWDNVDRITTALFSFADRILHPPGLVHRHRPIIILIDQHGWDELGHDPAIPRLVRTVRVTSCTLDSPPLAQS